MARLAPRCRRHGPAAGTVALGADYAVLTTRHHDAYCLWPTAEHDYHSMACFGRDLVAEYVAACRRHQIKGTLLLSLADWTQPAYFNGPDSDPQAFTDYVDGIHRMVHELLTQYGTIDIIWLDACALHDSPLWRSADLVAMIRQLQPGILINSRLGIDVQKGPNTSTAVLASVTATALVIIPLAKDVF